MCNGIALGNVNHRHFEVTAERELEIERRHDRRMGKEMTMSGKRNPKKKKEGERKRNCECKAKQPRATKRQKWKSLDVCRSNTANLSREEVR